MASSKKTSRKRDQIQARSKTSKPSQETHDNENGVFMTESPEDEGDSGPMSVVKQATLINYHLAIEDSVDIDKIWDVMQPIFNDDEQEDIQVCIGCVCVGVGGSVCLPFFLFVYNLAIEESVDRDRIWDVMQPVFNDDEQMIFRFL